MKKIYHLGKCSTCQRIIRELKITARNFTLQEIRSERITAAQLDEMKRLAGSYEALFSRAAIKYRTLGLAKKKLSERDFRKLILEEDTFLKRPVMIIDGKIFIGNGKNMIAGAKDCMKDGK